MIPVCKSLTVRNTFECVQLHIRKNSYLPETPDKTILLQILLEFNGRENASNLTEAFGHGNQFFARVKFVCAKPGGENIAHRGYQ
jgi:hypothetical protein